MPSRSELANAIRFLSVDAIERAGSGHPGAPMGMADIAEVLWNDFLKHNPSDPGWPDRDRFVLSNGHASMLLYSLLHLSGYELTVQDLMNFRQLNSRTPGHPEVHVTPGVETTTGPLGQGFANAVGMAIAEKMLAEKFNQDKYNIVDHYTYAFVGDGCLMEGISHEAASLAGTLKLGKLIVLYDDNNISIDGCVQGWFTEDTPARFQSYDWHVIGDVDGHNAEEVRDAIRRAREVVDRPSLICCRTRIAYGSVKYEGSHKSHGAPLGEEEIDAVRKNLGWQHPPFEVPEEIYAAWDGREKGVRLQGQWEELFQEYESEYPELAAEFKRRISGELPQDICSISDAVIEQMDAEGSSSATRKISKMVLDRTGSELPELIGGSADLSGSNKTLWSDSLPLTPDSCEGNYIYYGVREFAMVAIMNGIALHKGFIPYGGTFLIFSDYARNALRMSALMELGCIYVFTHDSIGVGEDGPTHQPVEQLSSLRLVPNMEVWRPCDAVECAVAWKRAIQNRDHPTVLALSRQGVEFQARSREKIQDIEKGGYVLKDAKDSLDVIILATGAEVGLVVRAEKELRKRGYGVRIVSMPCTEVFDSQSPEYRCSVLPAEVEKRLVVEAGASSLWYKYVGEKGRVIGLDRFGLSAPKGDLFEYLGFTVDNVVRAAEELMSGK
ncbi:MAG: transketolase [Thermodesulfobacteriota bacterium]